MNIDKIVRECPRAWEEWCEYVNYDYESVVDFSMGCIRFTPGTQQDIHFRELYDYFDSVGIKIEVSDKSYESYWVYNVDCYDDGKEFFYEGYDTRTEAEYKAFEKAFEIREQQLAKSVK